MVMDPYDETYNPDWWGCLLEGDKIKTVSGQAKNQLQFSMSEFIPGIYFILVKTNNIQTVNGVFAGIYSGQTHVHFTLSMN